MIDVSTNTYSNLNILPFREEPATFPTFDPNMIQVGVRPDTGNPYTPSIDLSVEMEATKLKLQKAKRRKR